MGKDNKEHVLRTAARMESFPFCPICGNPFDAPFTLISRNGIKYDVTLPEDTARHASHLVAEALGGKWTLDNLADFHSICNRRQQELPLDFFCDDVESHWTADKIRSQAILAQTRADAAISGQEVFPEMFRIAAELIRKGTGYARRTGKTLTDKILASASIQEDYTLTIDGAIVTREGLQAEVDFLDSLQSRVA